MSARSDQRRRLPHRGGSLLLAALAATAAFPAGAEIYKCTDRLGNITYQNEKCPGGGKAERVDVFDNNWTASGAEKDAQWQRNATDRRVVTGMPARWVREGFGEPAEIRDTSTGGAKELWVYNLSDRSLQIGMGDDRVIWFRETPVAVPTARVAPAPEKSVAAAPRSSAPADSPRPIDILRAPNAIGPADTASAPQRPETGRSTDAPRSAEVPRLADLPRAAEPPPRAAESTRASDAAGIADAPRAAALSPAVDSTRRIARGRDCKEVLSELGKPDRQREVPASDITGTDAVTEYVYEPGGRADATRTRILCANGKVEGVDRSVAR
jgi:hypothetical protein